MRWPIGVMLIEHNIGRDYVKGMSEAIGAYEAGDRGASVRIVENAKNHIALLTEQIDEEDNILNPIADGRLSVERHEELLKQFERVEDEKIGIGKHEEFRKLVSDLEGIHLR